jgi:cell division protein FtsA
MTSERIIIAGLDIGSAKTTAVIGQAVPADGKSAPYLRILGVGQARTTGLRKGVVSDIEETTRSIRKALSDAERVAGAKVESVYVGIAGEHVQAMTSTGIVAVNGDEITRADVERANEVARAQRISPDRELLHAIPQEYRVDRNNGIRDPVGMIGTRLETEVYLVTIGVSPAMNLRRAVERAGYRTRELVLKPLASALAVLTEDEKELGVALVEMGAGTTDLAIFHEGKIRHLATINFGGANVTSDIVHGLGVTQADAERLKERYGCAYEPLVDPADVIQLPSTVAQGDRQVPRELLARDVRRAPERRRRAHRRRGGDRGRRGAGERRLWNRRARRFPGGECRRLERRGRGAALRDRRRARGLRGAPHRARRRERGAAAHPRLLARSRPHREPREDVAPGLLLEPGGQDGRAIRLGMIAYSAPPRSDYIPSP